jgi:CheY-like chemotaxis protein
MPRVLVVEDDKYLNKLISDRLSLEGFEVYSALDGETALQQLKRPDASFDILFSDMLLPRMMGAELFSKIREEGVLPELKIFAMSGIYKDAQQIEEISGLHGLAGYWVKPFAIEELIASLSGKESTNAKPTEGLLSETSLEILFLRAYDEGLTGELNLKSESFERRIFFSGGFPVGASSTSLTESLGQSFISLGLITPQIQEEASRRMVEEGLQFGQMLIKMEALTQPQLFEALRKHTYRLLLNSFLMKHGSFRFKAMTELPAYILPLEFNPMLLILRAHRAFYSAELLNELFTHKRKQFGKLKRRAFQILPLLNLGADSMGFFQAFSSKVDFNSILSAVPEAGHEALFRHFNCIGWFKSINLTFVSEFSKWNSIHSNISPSVNYGKIGFNIVA